MKPTMGLQDIQGIDQISFWPLAIGWWIVLAVVVVVVGTLIFIYLRRQERLHSWQHYTLNQLEQLEQGLGPANSHRTAIQLSTLVRRLAIKKYSREECASLKGREWLSWLSENDAKKFDWMSAHCLIEAPFCPQDTVIDSQSLKVLIKAAKGWVQ